MQRGQFWLEGPQSRPIGNWQRERQWCLTDGLQIKVRPRLRGGAPQVTEDPRAYAEYGPIPSGCHICQ
eukprot:3670359-Prorocentrum_lima.AAC.1